MTDSAGAALWLIPDEPTLQAAIDALCVRHAAPCFTAHLTLLGGMALPPEPIACRALGEVAGSSAPFELPVTGTGESDDYFATAFIRCAETAQLSALRDRAQQLLGTGSAPEIGPHVSLVYGHLPRDVRCAIARAHAIAGPLRFTTLALVQSGPLGWKPVEQWRVICRHSLRA
jgi:hypothetical protein